MPKTSNTREARAFIAVKGEPWIWAAYTDEASAAADLPAVLAQRPGRPYEVLTDWDTFTAEAEARHMTPAREISPREFFDMLECLPPMQWETRDGIERFCMCEFTYGRITEQFAQAGGRYLRKSVRFNDRSTYISAADFDATRDPLAHLDRIAAEQAAIHGPTLTAALADIAEADEADALPPNA